MFTGIIEDSAEIQKIEKEGSNVHYTLKASLAPELKVDQSVAHDGVCLTVTSLSDEIYTVTAIDETLNRTSLGTKGVGDLLNLERCMLANGRFDGHIVQGHVDQIGIVKQVEVLDGSWKYHIQYDASKNNITVEKGSICINGVSLTVVDSREGYFSVAIIPYTFEHTNFKNLKVADVVNLEFDILGKYMQKILASGSKTQN